MLVEQRIVERDREEDHRKSEAYAEEDSEKQVEAAAAVEERESRGLESPGRRLRKSLIELAQIDLVAARRLYVCPFRGVE
jgi:hypothetical protein